MDAYICDVEAKNANNFLKLICKIGDTLPHLKRVKSGQQNKVSILIGTLDEFNLFLENEIFVKEVFPSLKEMMLPVSGELIHDSNITLYQVPKNRAYFRLTLFYFILFFIFLSIYFYFLIYFLFYFLLFIYFLFYFYFFFILVINLKNGKKYGQ